MILTRIFCESCMILAKILHEPHRILTGILTELGGFSNVSWMILARIIYDPGWILHDSSNDLARISSCMIPAKILHESRKDLAWISPESSRTLDWTCWFFKCSLNDSCNILPKSYRNSRASFLLVFTNEYLDTWQILTDLASILQEHTCKFLACSYM